MSWLKEFKTFALKGSMLDLAIGVIVGTAFSKVVASIVADLLMPIIGFFVGGVDFSQLSLRMHVPTSASFIEIRYGQFLNAFVDFIIISIIIFLIVKVVNQVRYSKAEQPQTQNCPQCQMAIPIAAKKCGHCCSELR